MTIIDVLPDAAPLRAPYLLGLPQISDELAQLAAAAEPPPDVKDRLAAELRRIASIVRDARDAYWAAKTPPDDFWQDDEWDDDWEYGDYGYGDSPDDRVRQRRIEPCFPDLEEHEEKPVPVRIAHYRRCPKCGALAEPPCRLCATQAWLAAAADRRAQRRARLIRYRRPLEPNIDENKKKRCA